MKKKFILDTFKLIKKKNKKFIFPASKFEYPILRSFKKDEQGNIKMLNKNISNIDPKIWMNIFMMQANFTGVVKKSWRKKYQFFDKYSGFYEIPKIHSQDIDDLEDFKLAEIIKKI